MHVKGYYFWTYVLGVMIFVVKVVQERSVIKPVSDPSVLVCFKGLRA